MRALLVEDHVLYGPLIQRELIERYGYDVDYVAEPAAAAAKMAVKTYDVVVVDLLYQHHIVDFARRKRDREVALSDPSFLVSGLAVLDAACGLERPPGLVVLSSGEENRSLHLQWAYQEFGVRAYCAKGGARSEGLTGISEAMRAADGRRIRIDPELEVYLGMADSPPIAELLFGRVQHRLIWRALALGATTHREIARLINYSEKTSRTEVSQMLLCLAVLDPGTDTNVPPLDALMSYAVRNWPFFLDDTVIGRCPHRS